MYVSGRRNSGHSASMKQRTGVIGGSGSIAADRSALSTALTCQAMFAARCDRSRPSAYSRSSVLKNLLDVLNLDLALVQPCVDHEDPAGHDDDVIDDPPVGQRAPRRRVGEQSPLSVLRTLTPTGFLAPMRSPGTYRARARPAGTPWRQPKHAYKTGTADKLVETT